LKGELHKGLRATLTAAWTNGAFTQDSLCASMGKSQRSVSQYLNGEADAGALDLDEAAAALAHAGSSLPEFLASVPPRPLTRAERLGNRLEGRDDVIDLVEALLDVPPKRLPAVRELISAGFYAATGRRLKLPSGSAIGNAPATRTTKAPARRRRARARRKQTDDE
jgi:transcriptional regulator with XRE-family HTH domain